MVVDGQQLSEFVPVQSCIPQGTILGSLMLLVYINDISGGTVFPLIYDSLLTAVSFTV